MQQQKEDNKLAGSRRDLLHEMTVQISKPLAKHPFFAKLLDSLQEALRDNGLPGLGPSKYVLIKPPEDIEGAKYITWQRTTKRFYDTTRNPPIWTRYPDGLPHVLAEPFVMLYFTASEVAEYVSEGKDALWEHISELKDGGKWPESEYQCFVFIEGLDKYKQKEKRAQQKEFANDFRGEEGSKGKKKTGPVSAEDLEDALCDLGVKHRCHVNYGSKADEVMRNILEFTLDIGYRPHKSGISSLIFCCC